MTHIGRYKKTQTEKTTQITPVFKVEEQQETLLFTMNNEIEHVTPLEAIKLRNLISRWANEKRSRENNNLRSHRQKP